MSRLLIVGLAFAALQDATAPLLPEPDANVQKDTLKLVRDLFKDEYARKSPADQQGLARKLLAKGSEAKDDANARYVLLREARDIAAGAGDVETSLKAVDELSRAFAVDGVALKLAALAKAAALAKDADSARSAARGYLSVLPDAVGRDNFEAASTAAAKAEPLAKAAQDVALSTRAQESRKEVSALKEEYQKVKGALDAPGTGDQDALGRYLCFVKSQWTPGLKLLLVHAKPPLSTLAEKDLADPKDPEKQLEVGDGWYDLATKEKIAWKKGRLLGRARLWYEAAMPGLTGLAQVKAEKRLAEIEESGVSGAGAINLLWLVDPKQHKVAGAWTKEGPALAGSPEKYSRIIVPYEPPDEYDLVLTFVRRRGTTFLVGLPGRAMLTLDGSGGGVSGLEVVDGKRGSENETAVNGSVLQDGKRVTLTCAVRKGGVAVTLDDRKIIDWKGDRSRLSMPQDWPVPNPKALWLGCWESDFLITRVSLVPLSTGGKKVK